MNSFIHILWVGLLLCSPAAVLEGASVKEATKRITRAAASLDHEFDLGPLRCCTNMPRNSTVCPDVTHPIPCTVATELSIIEQWIQSTVSGVSNVPGSMDPQQCADNVRDILCKQNFPECSEAPAAESYHVQFPNLQCETTLSVCPPMLKSQLINEGICSLSNGSSYPISDCTASGPARKLILSHCTVDWYLPQWILQYVKKINMELASSKSVFIDNMGTSQACWEQYRQFRCNSVGRCWAQGDRLEHINSREYCNEVLRCLPDAVQILLRAQLSCSMLPSEQERLGTVSTSITDKPTSQPTDATGSQNINDTATTKSPTDPITSGEQFSKGSTASLSFISLVILIVVQFL